MEGRSCRCLKWTLLSIVFTLQSLTIGFGCFSVFALHSNGLCLQYRSLKLVKHWVYFTTAHSQFAVKEVEIHADRSITAALMMICKHLAFVVNQKQHDKTHLIVLSAPRFSFSPQDNNHFNPDLDKAVEPSWLSNYARDDSVPFKNSVDAAAVLQTWHNVRRFTLTGSHKKSYCIWNIGFRHKCISAVDWSYCRLPACYLHHFSFFHPIFMTLISCN